MKLSTRCRYGIRALIEISRRHRQGPVKRREIAQAQGITAAYLENIFTVLKAKHLVEPIRGASGGFILARPPDRITLLEAVNALEGTIAPVDCVENAARCERAGGCAARQVWKRVHDAQTTVLEGITFRDLLEMEKSGDQISYDI